jgi:hypothetical protein
MATLQSNRISFVFATKDSGPERDQHCVAPRKRHVRVNRPQQSAMYSADVGQQAFF